MLINFAIPRDRNVIKKGTEKILKYRRPHNRNSTHVECKNGVLPAIIGTTGTVSKSYRQYLSDVPEKHEIKELQKQPY